MKKRRQNKNFSNIGDVLNTVLPQYRPMSDPSLLRVWDLWKDAVGDRIAANASPAAFKGKTLLVHVSNSTWLHHLRFMEMDLMAKLNDAMGGQGEVQKLQFKIGPV